MSGRTTKLKTMLLNGKCFNRECDARNVCSVYSSTATDEERDHFLELPMIQCPLFLLKNPPSPRTNDVYAEDF